VSKEKEGVFEMYSVAPVFADGVAVLESLGSVTHLLFTCRQSSPHEPGDVMRVVQVRLIVPTEQIATFARVLTNRATGGPALGDDSENVGDAAVH